MLVDGSGQATSISIAIPLRLLLDRFLNVINSLHRLFPNFGSQPLSVLRPIRLPMLQLIDAHRVETPLEILQFLKS